MRDECGKGYYNTTPRNHDEIREDEATAAAAPRPVAAASERMHISVSATRRVAARLLSLAALQQFLPPQAGHAVKGAKGAAELDAEFYLRGLLGQPSLPPLKLELPKDRALTGLVTCTLLSATRAALASTLDISVSEVAVRASARRSSLAIEYERAVLAGAFGPAYDMSMAGGTRLALGQASGATACTDGGGGDGDVGLYEFELSLYALFTLLSEARLPPARQKAFNALLGDSLLAAQLSSSPAALPATGSAVSLKRVEAGLEALMQALQRAGYLAGFKIDNSDADEALWVQRSELSTTRYTITLANPASLRAATQLNAASGGRVTPGLAVPLLLAFLRASGVTVLQQSEYFLDDEYKPNPIACAARPCCPVARTQRTVHCAHPHRSPRNHSPRLSTLISVRTPHHTAPHRACTGTTPPHSWSSSSSHPSRQRRVHAHRRDSDMAPSRPYTKLTNFSGRELCALYFLSFLLPAEHTSRAGARSAARTWTL